MKHVISTNVFWLAVLFLLIPIIHYSTDFDLLILSQLFMIWALTIMFHEMGHWFFGKMRGMEMSFLTTLFGMYKGGLNWKLNIPLYFSFGTCLMYKPVSRGPNTKQDLIWLLLGGGIFNIIVSAIFVVIIYGLNIDNEFLNYILLFNIVIWLATWFPVKGSDGGRVLKLLRGDHEELEAFDALSHMYDPDVDAETILHKFKGGHDYFSSYVKNIAFMEINSGNPSDYSKIYSAEIKDKIEDQQTLLQGFQLLFKHIDGHELNNSEVEVFSRIKSLYKEVFSKFHIYFKTGEEKHLEELKKKDDHFTNHRENKILQRILTRM